MLEREGNCDPYDFNNQTAVHSSVEENNRVGNPDNDLKTSFRTDPRSNDERL